MKIKLDCFPCYVNQALEAAEYANMNQEKKWNTVLTVCEELAKVERSEPSARIGQKVHKIVRDFSNTEDPYREQKEKSNEIALGYLEEFRDKLAESEEKLNIAARLAAAGNAIDFGPRREFDVEGELKRGMNEEFEINHWEKFLEQLETAKEILYFTDNSGEIIYDRLFVEQLLGASEVEKLNLVVKQGPFLNDVTEEDAVDLGLDEINKVYLRTVDNGDGGNSPGLWSNEVEKWIEGHDLVVSKGQANYEGLSTYSKENLFFLLVIKCPLVERAVGADVGKKVFINASDQPG